MSTKTTQSKTPRVVIIGGGLAGLSAAEALARHHNSRFEITLLEAKRNTGGRAGSFSDPETRESVDYCQHVAMGCCTNLLALLQRRIAIRDRGIIQSPRPLVTGRGRKTLGEPVARFRRIGSSPCGLRTRSRRRLSPALREGDRPRGERAADGERD